MVFVIEKSFVSGYNIVSEDPALFYWDYYHLDADDVLKKIEYLNSKDWVCGQPIFKFRGGLLNG